MSRSIRRGKTSFRQIDLYDLAVSEGRLRTVYAIYKMGLCATYISAITHWYVITARDEYCDDMSPNNLTLYIKS